MLSGDMVQKKRKTDGGVDHLPLRLASIWNAFLALTNKKVVFGQVQWVAVGEGPGNTMARSTDGVSWTPMATPVSPFDSDGRGVAFSSKQQRWVAVGGTVFSVAVSVDGVTWSDKNAIFSSRGHGVGYSAALDQWIIVGEKGTAASAVFHSRNAVAWLPSTAAFWTRAYGVAYSSLQRRWVGVGQGPGTTIAHSVDGITWTPAGGTTFSTDGFGVTYSLADDLLVAVGQDSLGRTILHSRDGVNWQAAANPPFTTQGMGVVKGSSKWIAVGNGGDTFGSSSDGLNWSPQLPRLQTF